MQNLARIGLFSAVLTLLLTPPTTVASMQGYTPPTQVTVTMYQLDPITGVIQQPPTLCGSGNAKWGCTAFVGDDNHPYPYGSTNPVIVPIESDYLLDVVSQELSPDRYHSTALGAQAIVARTYAYYHIQQGHTFDNSTNKQVFIPYKFESLSPTIFPDNIGAPCASSNLDAQQQAVCNATENVEALAQIRAAG